MRGRKCLLLWQISMLGEAFEQEGEGKKKGGGGAIYQILCCII